jgi:hypothetical protein
MMENEAMVAEIAAQLTTAQREAFRRMRVQEPSSFMPNYHGVEFYGGDLPPLEIKALQEAGLVSLPIAKGGRFSPTYLGEIHPLGLAVRRRLTSLPTPNPSGG